MSFSIDPIAVFAKRSRNQGRDINLWNPIIDLVMNISNNKLIDSTKI